MSEKKGKRLKEEGEKRKFPKFIYESEDQKIGLYSDVARVAFNISTFSFDFAQLLPPETGEEAVVRVLARVVMSPEHAKRFLEHLASQIKAYEDTFGEIKVPKRRK